MEKDAFYFPHFCNARQDRKIKRVRKELGLEGYGIYFMLLETLREQQEFKFPMEDIDLLSDEFGTSEQKIRTVICNYDLFQLDNEENFFSVSFIKYLTPYLEGKQRKKIAGIKGNLIKYGYAKKEDLDNLSDLEILEINENRSIIPKLSHSESDCDSSTIRNGSQSKGKEIKEKENKENNIYTDVFNYYLTKNNLIKHKKFSSDMKKAIDISINTYSLDLEYMKRIIDRHSEKVEATKEKGQYSVKVRTLAELFGQKIKDSPSIICSVYLDEVYKNEIKDIKPIEKIENKKEWGVSEWT